MTRKIKTRKRKGLASLLIVFLVAMFSILVIASWQSRVLLSIHRGEALTDNLTATYHAETEINDVISRILGEYPLPDPGSRTLDDGTVLTLARNVTGNTEVVNVHAKRQFASTRIQVTKTTLEEASNVYDKVEIVLAADCTGSMGYQSNPTCTGSSCPSRLSSQRDAILNFIDAIASLPVEQRENYSLGIMTFKIGQRWISYGGVSMEPTQDWENLSRAVSSGFMNNVNSSPACNFSNPYVPGSVGETSLGTPSVFVADYFKPRIEPRKKQIYILITDGLPNASLEDSRCGSTNCRSNEGGSCTNSALTYLECGLADTNTTWGSSRLGLRDPNVDAYGVIVLSAPTNTQERLAYEGAVNLFSNPNYIQQPYYHSDNADNLTDFLDDIFTSIQTKATTLEIERVVPTPVRNFF